MIKSNLKIMSCNLNGIKSAKKKGFLDVISDSDPDIICIQETKSHAENLPDDLMQIPGYMSKFYSNSKKGISGVAIYSKLVPNDYEYGLTIEEGIEGRLIRFDFDNFTLINVYTPSGGKKINLAHKHDFLRKLFLYVEMLHDEGKNVIMCGDFNIAHTEKDLYFKNFKKAGFLPVEREMITEFLKSGFKDAFRELHPNDEEFTWYSWRSRNHPELGGGMRLDYFFVSEEIMEAVEKCEIYDYNLSDHNQLFLTIKL
ncbi:MAG: exodeoxyribonuclease III [Methanobacteriaceae archaeon]|nr:exodeoxyribonuclease III [Methanobacteriaceae archaeon]